MDQKRTKKTPRTTTAAIALTSVLALAILGSAAWKASDMSGKRLRMDTSNVAARSADALRAAGR